MKRLPIILATAAALGVAAVADERRAGIDAIDLAALDYRESPVFAGVALAEVLGDVSEPGLYATHAVMAADSRVGPHTHPDPRLTVVTDGVMYVGVGERFDEDALVAFPEGSVFVTHADAPHFMWAKDGAVSVLDFGAGPSGATLIGG